MTTKLQKKCAALDKRALKLKTRSKLRNAEIDNIRTIIQLTDQLTRIFPRETITLALDTVEERLSELEKNRGSAGAHGRL